MKRINIVKISLDIIMAIVFVLLYNKMVIYGITFHEVAGLAIGAVFIVHIALNWRWAKQVTLNIFRKKISHKTRIGYVVDILLLLAVVYIIVSGILISKVVFRNLHFGNDMFFRSTHISVSYAALLLIGIHLGLHWDWVMSTVKRIFRIAHMKKVWDYIAKAAVIIVLLFGLYSMYSTSYFTKLPIVQEFAGGGERPGHDKGIEDYGKVNKAEGRINNYGEGVPDSNEGMKRPSGGKGFASVNPLNTVATYLGIIAVFAIFTFYIEKLLLKKRTGGRRLIAGL